jgi:predicted metalloprotease with PDZ domain
MRVQGAPSSLRLAMKVHPEYDARFWRFLDSMTVTGTADDRAVQIRRRDSTLWQVAIPGGRGEINYLLHLLPDEPGLRDAWRCVVRDDGALLNPPDVLLYLADFASQPATIELRIPRSWSVATSLTTSDSGRILRAPNVAVMLDAPMLLGHLREWRFRLAKHDVFVDYWPLPNAQPFDTTAFVDVLRRLSAQALAIFRSLPSPSYHFLLEDGAGDALEHGSSVTIGVPSAELSRNPRARIDDIAHEFFHTWNLVAIHPDSYGHLSYMRPAPTTGLWLGEGVTLYYADVLVRRAGLADSTTGTRAERLADLLSRYYGATWRGRVSPEAASLAFGQTLLVNPSATGSYYLQGELVGEALDATIRDSTHDRRTLDDVMRALYARSAGGHGFTDGELVGIVDSLCSCRMDRWFADVVQGPAPIDLAPAARRLGWHLVVDTVPAIDPRGRPLADARLGGAVVDSSVRFIVTTPTGLWGRVGLRTGDVVVDVNGARPTTFFDLFHAVRGMAVGDSLTMNVRRDGVPIHIATVMSGYDRPRVRLVDLAAVTPEQQSRRTRWLSGW